MGSERSRDRRRFGRQLQRWTDIVASFSEPRRFRRRVDAREYRAVHERVLADCRRMVESADDVERQFFLGLERLIRPWMSVESLEGAEEGIQVDLRRKCEAALELLTGSRRSRDRSPRRQRRVRRIRLVLALAAVLVAFGFWARDSFYFPRSIDEVDAIVKRWWFEVSSDGFFGKFVVAASVTVALSIWVISSSTKRQY